MNEWPWFGHESDVQRKLDIIIKMLGEVMSEQSQIDADVQAEEALVVRINAAVALILTEIQNLQSSNPQVDLTGLNQAVSDLSAATGAVEGLETPAPAAPPAS